MSELVKWFDCMTYREFLGEWESLLNAHEGSRVVIEHAHPNEDSWIYKIADSGRMEKCEARIRRGVLTGSGRDKSILEYLVEFARHATADHALTYLRKKYGGEEAFEIVDCSSADLADEDCSVEYLVEGLLADHQNFVIAGPQKSLKTSVAIDILTAIGSGTEALNFFPTKKGNVGFVSGESGKATLKETHRRVCECKGMRPHDVTMYWSFQIPQLMNDAHLTALRRWIERRKLDALFVDPAYLATLDSNTAGQAGNLFVMGAALRGFSQLAVDTGITPGLLHHTTKQSSRQANIDGKPLGLEDMSQSGFSEFCRQWLLLSRRSPWTGNGTSYLWGAYGGSAGHGGIIGIDVREGLLSDLGGRHWAVTTRTKEDVDQEQADRITEGVGLVEDAKLEKAQSLVREFMKQKGKIVLRDLNRVKGVKHELVRDAFDELLERQEIRPTTITKNRREYDAYELAS